MIRTFATLLTFAIVVGLASSEAQAQLFSRRGSARQGMTSSSGMTTAPTARVYSYSYYTRSNLPARTYVGYGDNDFPYHGAPYGHPYDPWTWPAMSGSYQGGLARYNSPPLK
jgi:hypothetical protein